MSCPLNSREEHEKEIQKQVDEMCEHDRLKELKHSLNNYLKVKYEKGTQEKIEDVWRKLCKIL